MRRHTSIAKKYLHLLVLKWYNDLKLKVKGGGVYEYFRL